MKLIDLFEEKYDFISKELRKDCEFYFSQVKDPNLWLYRGSQSKLYHGMRYPFRQRERPVDTPGWAHREMNEFFQEKYGHPFRNGLFVSGSADQASQYGKIQIVIPKGKFEWLTSPEIEDLATTFMHAEDEEDEGADANADEELIHELKTSDWVHSKDLEECIRSENEIMLWCPEGYFVLNPGLIGIR
jgi:hypothetical protein